MRSVTSQRPSQRRLCTHRLPRHLASAAAPRAHAVSHTSPLTQRWMARGRVGQRGPGVAQPRSFPVSTRRGVRWDEGRRGQMVENLVCRPCWQADAAGAGRSRAVRATAPPSGQRQGDLTQDRAWWGARCTILYRHSRIGPPYRGPIVVQRRDRPGRPMDMRCPADLRRAVTIGQSWDLTRMLSALTRLTTMGGSPGLLVATSPRGCRYEGLARYIPGCRWHAPE